ncbi:hypothetical protein SK854_45970 [Lentzea sp. BCCO 10_0061]|uniref:NACHT domain-containing protein n=1 Tax=Lentzea sokolovensis TaxID=3095429 RepID=A0ABU4VF36_9PSEU|nr:hypothetical protein [Lentzea sp. BCCO 10_0061]MDX8149538.1 hypothetical protein [Lentzea sp. BCCO 10_0061]
MNLRRWRLAVVAFAVSVIGVLIWLTTPDAGGELGGVAGAVLAVAGLVAGLLSLRTNDTARDPDQALEDLARLVAGRWERTRQDPLEARWASTGRPVSPSPAEIIGTGVVAGRPIRLKLHGEAGDLTKALCALPAHQLVVLGEPGCGKTSAAVQLTLRLLAQREPGDLVPVLFPLASWNPGKQDLDEWMARRISADHPVFRRRGKRVARELVERGLVLPVLDALDEVVLKADAVRDIARVAEQTRPLVLTCRADDYEEIVRESGVLVGRAAVVELRRLSVSGVKHQGRRHQAEPAGTSLGESVRPDPERGHADVLAGGPVVPHQVVGRQPEQDPPHRPDELLHAGLDHDPQ